SGILCAIGGAHFVPRTSLLIGLTATADSGLAGTRGILAAVLSLSGQAPGKSTTARSVSAIRGTAPTRQCHYFGWFS
ncbi:MAG: hypothetical protein VW686_00690, partial [Luminiphilus sp.]